MCNYLGIGVSTVGRHFLEHRLEDGRLETGQSVSVQPDLGTIAITVSCNTTRDKYTILK